MIIGRDITPSDHLFKEVRARLILRGLSFSAYCRNAGLTRQNATSALSGKWTGPKAAEVVETILSDLGMAR